MKKLFVILMVLTMLVSFALPVAAEQAKALPK